MPPSPPCGAYLIDSMPGNSCPRRTSCLSILTFGAIALALACGPAPEAPPRLIGVVNDFANVLAADERATLESDIVQFGNAHGVILVVATVNSFQPFPSIRAFAAELFKNDGRGLGDAARHNGLLIVLAVDDRQVWITPGFGLEHTVTDTVAADVAQQMTVKFRSGSYGQGLRAGVEALGRVFEAARRR